MSLKIANIVNNGNIKPYLSKFLTIQEQADLEMYKGDLEIRFSNTYIDEERKRAFVYPKDFFPKDIKITPDFKISFIKVKSTNKLRHPDILGAVLNTGIDREVIGDIIIDDQIILCTDEIANYLLNNLHIIHKQRVELEKVTNFNYGNTNNYLEKQIIISSLRLDSIIAKALNLSRSKAQELISKRIVRINGNIEINCDYICIESDIVSITRFGRIKILDVTRKTKKNKIVLNILLTKK